MAASTWERETLRAVSSTLTWSAAMADSNGLWSSEKSGVADSVPLRGIGLAVQVAVLLARGLLELREALEAERLGEAHDGRG